MQKNPKIKNFEERVKILDGQTQWRSNNRNLRDRQWISYRIRIHKSYSKFKEIQKNAFERFENRISDYLNNFFSFPISDKIFITKCNTKFDPKIKKNYLQYKKSMEDIICRHWRCWKLLKTIK